MAPNADIAEKDHLWMGTSYQEFTNIGVKSQQTGSNSQA